MTTRRFLPAALLSHPAHADGLSGWRAASADGQASESPRKPGFVVQVAKNADLAE